MPRPKSVEPSRSLNTHLDEHWMARLDIHLFSSLEDRVPKGAYQRFFNERLREFFTLKHLDLSPYVGSLPGTLRVSGSEQAIESLKRALEAQTNVT